MNHSPGQDAVASRRDGRRRQGDGDDDGDIDGHGPLGAGGHLRRSGVDGHRRPEGHHDNRFEDQVNEYRRRRHHPNLARGAGEGDKEGASDDDPPPDDTGVTHHPPRPTRDATRSGGPSAAGPGAPPF